MGKQIVKSGFVGLFWFDENHSSITDCMGEVEFSLSDLTRKETILPVGTHRSYGGNSSYMSPRGRIEVNEGRIVISVGLLCPSNMIEAVINQFNLQPFRSVIEINRNRFWDKRMIGSRRGS